MDIRRLDPADAPAYRAGFRSFGVEPRAIKVDGRFFAKNHMALALEAV